MNLLFFEHMYTPLEEDNCFLTTTVPTNESQTASKAYIYARVENAYTKRFPTDKTPAYSVYMRFHRFFILGVYIRPHGLCSFRFIYTYILESYKMT